MSQGEVIFEGPPHMHDEHEPEHEHAQKEEGHPPASELELESVKLDEASTPKPTELVHEEAHPNSNPAEPESHNTSSSTLNGTSTAHTDDDSPSPLPTHERTPSSFSVASQPHPHPPTHIHSPRPRRPSTTSTLTVDRDAQDQVIASLRLQIQDLISQVSQLNAKLVKSYDRVSDLEDDLHVASSSLRASTLKISQLELERTQHLSALNTGLLVEKTHVTAELNRLMERATEEAAQRGQAESARMAIEKDLDDLSASLFGQANAMVAEARFEKHLSERKVEDAERALKSAEEAVKVMQAQMQGMMVEREEAERRAREAEAAMGKGKWVQRLDGASAQSPSLKLLNLHTPYLDYLAFIAHLRVLHPTSPHATPAMSTLLQLPFLARLMAEDSDPTVRLDLAPSLNWLSRRSVLAAIHSGQLTIEPIPAASLFPDLSFSSASNANSNTNANSNSNSSSNPNANSSASPYSSYTQGTGYSSSYNHNYAHGSSNITIAGLNSSGDNISCALCGTSVFPPPPSSSTSSSDPSSTSTSNSNSSWSGATAFFKKASVGMGVPGSPTRSSMRRSSMQLLTATGNRNTQIFIFRLASPPSSTIASLPLPSLTKSSSGSGSSTLLPSSASGSGAGTPSSSSSQLPLPNLMSHSTSNPHPPPTSTTANTQPTTIYPLCQSGWCLARLRSTCTLWAFVRTGIVDKVWEEDLPPPSVPPRHPSHTSSVGSHSGASVNGAAGLHGQGQVPPEHLPTSSLSPGGEKPPPVPPRKRGLWGIASALGERAVSWGSGDKAPTSSQNQASPQSQTQAQAQGKDQGKDQGKAGEKAVPAPPPQHPSQTQSHVQPKQETRRVPPLPGSQQQPPPYTSGTTTNATTATTASRTASPAPPPPPLPKRSEGRSRTPVQNSTSPPPPGSSGETEPSKDHLHPATASQAQTNPPALPPRAQGHAGHARTPSTVPLPDSRPGTPAASAAQGPSRATSPAPPQAGNGGQGGAPPPIPRRAAARARGAAPGGSRPGTPAATGDKSPVSPVVEAEEKKEKEAEGGKPAEADAPSSSSVEGQPDAAPAPEGPSAIVATADSTATEASADVEKANEAAPAAASVQVVGSDVFVDAPTPSPGVESMTSAPVEEEKKVDAAVEGDKKDESENKPAVNTNGVQPHPNGSREEADGEEFVHINGAGATSASTVTSSPVDEHPKVQEDKAADEDKVIEKAKEEENENEKHKDPSTTAAPATYVGDATWEERTWKELVRLREDMFWARVGVFRDA